MKNLKFIIVLTFFTVFIISCGDTKCPKCKGSGYFAKKYQVTEKYKVPIEYTVPVKYTAKEDCYNCKNKGRLYCTYKVKATGMLGLSTVYQCVNGRLEVTGNNNPYGGSHAGKRCPSCQGIGHFECERCNGYGYKNIAKTKNETRTKYETKTKKVIKTKKIQDEYCEGKGKVSKFSEMFN